MGGTAEYDILIRNGTIYDGRGLKPAVADVAINGDKIARIGKLGNARGKKEIDARGFAVAPGFINMLSSIAVWHAMWRPLSARRPCASTKSAMKIVRLLQRSSSGCKNSSVKPWKKARLVLGHP